MGRPIFSWNNLTFSLCSLSDYRKTARQSVQPSSIRTLDEGGKQDVVFARHVSWSNQNKKTATTENFNKKPPYFETFEQALDQYPHILEEGKLEKYLEFNLSTLPHELKVSE